MPRSRVRAAAALAAGAYGVHRWVAAADADPQSVRRKIAVATWSAPREGRLMSRLVVDADPVLEHVTARRAEGSQGLTAMHVVGAAAARALLAVPAGNARVLGGRGSDLAPVKVPAADTLTPGEIASAVRQGVHALRAGTDPGFRTSSRVAAAVPVPLMRPLMSMASVVLGASAGRCSASRAPRWARSSSATWHRWASRRSSSHPCRSRAPTSTSRSAR